MGLVSLDVYLNGEVLKSFSEEEIKDDTSVKNVTVNSSDKSQTITIVAKDYAGNEQTIIYSGIVVNPNLVENGSAGSDNSSEGSSGEVVTKTVSSTAPQWYLYVIGGVVVIGVAIAAVLTLTAKGKNKDKEQKKAA